MNRDSARADSLSADAATDTPDWNVLFFGDNIRELLDELVDPIADPVHQIIGPLRPYRRRDQNQREATCETQRTDVHRRLLQRFLRLDLEATEPP
jgi:hypothetical protein